MSAAAALIALLPAQAASADAGDPPPPVLAISTASGITTTGAVINGTVNPKGTDTLYQIVYGLTSSGAFGSSTFYVDAGSGTDPVTVAFPISQLAPNSSYSFEISAFVNATGTGYESDPGTLTTSPLPTGPTTPLVPPADPAANGSFSFCSADSECLSDMNGVRAAQENLPALVLPSNWATLTGPEQMFVYTDLERVSRGEAPIPTLVNTYDVAVQAGVANDADPVLSGLPGLGGSIWSGYPTVLSSFLGWEYYDGPGGANGDCVKPTDAGCWGHRNNLLANGATWGNPTEMDAGAGVDTGGSPSFAALLVVNPHPTPAASIVLTWAQEQQFL